MQIQPFDKVDFKDTETLMYEYRNINSSWEKGNIGDIDTQKLNYEFIKTMREKTDNMEREVQKYYQILSKDKLQDILSGLLKVVQRNIKVYLDKEEEINTYNFENIHKHQIYVQTHEKLKKNQIEFNEMNVKILEDGFYGTNWYKPIYEHSVITEEIIKKYTNSQQTKDNATLKQQIVILHYLDILDKIGIENNTTKKAKLLSYILNRNEQNIRNVLTYMYKKSKSNPFDKDNLGFAKNVFTELGLNDLAQKVISDIEKKK